MSSCPDAGLRHDRGVLWIRFISDVPDPRNPVRTVPGERIQIDPRSML
jgi:hypothetical protein